MPNWCPFLSADTVRASPALPGPRPQDTAAFRCCDGALFETSTQNTTRERERETTIPIRHLRKKFKQSTELFIWILNFMFFLRSCTWLPPMLWHTYMITGFPPWLFSPTSRQVLDPRFFNWRTHRHKNTFKDTQRKSSNMCWTSYCWNPHKASEAKHDSPHQTFLGLNLGCRFLGRWCLGTRWSSCNSASLSGSDDQRCPHTYSAKVTWSQLKLNDLNVMLSLR